MIICMRKQTVGLLKNSIGDKCDNKVTGIFSFHSQAVLNTVVLT